MFLLYSQIIGLSGKSCTHFIFRIANYPVDKIICPLNNWGLVGKFGIFIQHLVSCSSYKSVKADDRAKLKGYLRKWKSGKMFIYSCFFIDLSETAACLSAAFHETKVDAVTVSLAMAKAKKHLLALKEKEVAS